MKKFLSVFLALTFLVLCAVTGSPKSEAAFKAEQSRAIAILFDNSDSMYWNDNQAWCRATYAMEVFASMLNKGDTLLIYPMNHIEVKGKRYNTENPLKITDASQASLIREIYTPDAHGTPIESVDDVIAQIRKVNADKKYMIVLTDGEEFTQSTRTQKNGLLFYQEGAGLGQTKTVQELDKRFKDNAGKNLTIMYLGIGNNVAMPTTENSEYFVKKQASNSQDTLSVLTDLCNLIFGRNTLPKNHISGKKVSFDISISKLIVFVQGGNVSGLKVSGGGLGKPLASSTAKYSTAGAGDWKSKPDTNLSGMMVTYESVPAGEYTIEYSGTATSVEVYYEPDADLDFVFTDAAGNNVDPNALYEGEYKVSFGMKDAKTGKLIASDLLGNPHYQGSYSINGKETSFTHDGYSGEVPINLKMNDTFDARLTATYLSGYTITKDSTDFGWPQGGIQVAARPAGDLQLQVSGGREAYSLDALEQGPSYVIDVYYQGNKLTGDALENVSMEWQSDSEGGRGEISFAEDHYELKFFYPDSSAPQNTSCGEFSGVVRGAYAEDGSATAVATSQITYKIVDDSSSLNVEMYAPQDYVVISDLDKCKEIVVSVTLNGQPLSLEDFAATEIFVECGGIEYSVTPNEQESSYLIRLHSTEGISPGDYPVKATVKYTDQIGRVAQAEDERSITLSNIPLWVKWLFWILLIVLLIILIMMILHIKVLPKYAHITRKESVFYFDSEEQTSATSFNGRIQKGQMEILSTYAGTKTGIALNVKPGKESYLKKSQVRRSAEVMNPETIRKIGTATIQEASIGSVQYVLNEESGKLERSPMTSRPYVLKHGMNISYSGMMMNAGTMKPFTVTTKLNYKKK